MTLDQTILFLIFFVVFVLLIWGRWRYDIVAFSALLVAVLFGLIPVQNAFSGFGSPATVVVALVLIISAGLVKSGVISGLTKWIHKKGRGLGGHIAVIGSIGALLSAFMNNVATLAMLMPVDMQTARKSKWNYRESLMPLSFATILGGMVTLIGTPPNIIISSIREEHVGEAFGMFDFFPAGIVAGTFGLLFLALIGWRWIPRSEESKDAAEKLMETPRYVAELSIPIDSPLIGKKVLDLYDQGEESEVAILGLVRDGKRIYGTAGTTIMRYEDALVIDATPNEVEEFRASLSLEFSDAKRQEITEDEDGMSLCEVVVPTNSRISGRSAQAIGLSWRKKTILLGISRHGKRIKKQVRKTAVRSGDILLLLAPLDEQSEVISWLGCLPLMSRVPQITNDEKLWPAIVVFLSAILAASLGLIYLPLALACVVVAYVILNIIGIVDIYDNVEWSVVVLLGSMIPLGMAFESVGGTSLVVTSLMDITEGWPVWSILATLMIVTMTLSDVLNNTATAIVAAPIGIELAARLEVSPDPFLMAVAIAASCAFLTPIGHKNNTLIMGPGGYSFSDYWRMGLPLEIIIVSVSIPAILLIWPL